MLRQSELIEKVKSYDPNADEEALERAYLFAMKMHGVQKRESGEPYFSHPVEVAEILTDYKLDCATIITALLHDTIEDTTATHMDIEKLFGKEVATLVEGVTKLSKIQLNSEKSKQAENLRKLVLAMSEDIRVLLVKLADRVHNMRTLHFVKDPVKRLQKAKETLDIYAPLAERLGIHRMKDILEDLAFKEVKPEAYASIQTRLNFLREKDSNLIPKIIEEFEKDMSPTKLDFKIYGREKKPYSIWRKMVNQSITFEQICDIMAFRIVVPSVADCYHTLGVIHTKYPMVPGRYKDYISTPKPNGYQSLHTGIIGPFRQRVEVQIRTPEMHEVAEYGVAAHWQYKQKDYKADGKQFRWLRELVELLEQSNDPNEFLEHTKMAMYENQVFCFTPKGDLIELPKDASPVDFAYAIHSRVGDHCVGAKINGNIKPLRTPLMNGDQVEILTSNAQTPSAEWERFVVTPKAKSAIRRYVRQEKRVLHISHGLSQLQKIYQEAKKSYAEKEIEHDLEKVTEFYRQESAEDLLVAIGAGLFGAKDVFSRMFPEHKTTFQKVVGVFKKETKRKNLSQVPIKGLVSGLSVSYAKCCHPLPGDKIVGIVHTGRGVTIHTEDCPVLKRYVKEPERWMEISWDDDALSRQVDTASYAVRLRIVLKDSPGSLSSISTSIAKNQGNIVSLNTIHRSGGFTELIMEIEVSSALALEDLIASLNASPLVTFVGRIKS
ncbi:MAG: bifunctional (p)ppGpp synthetase/guanosine-3',5'-bis(diphosphate) 3'-pyrophosphohydrolase [Alphaproteobacteria bacterium]|nr:bifunctional (p)ppGpp synthetase/guanosine-3',5'-bis(diphosphate) 3'-pyrophosphohydrolase [Alphaproteobacteria bacterium]